MFLQVNFPNTGTVQIEVGNIRQANSAADLHSSEVVTSTLSRICLLRVRSKTLGESLLQQVGHHWPPDRGRAAVLPLPAAALFHKSVGTAEVPSLALALHTRPCPPTLVPGPPRRVARKWRTTLHCWWSLVWLIQIEMCLNKHVGFFGKHLPKSRWI